RPLTRPHARRSEVRPMPLTELPFGLPGRIFRSPMPFGPYDLHGDAYDCFGAEQIAVIVLLASDAECLHKSGCHLRTLYHQAGFQVVYLPIPDFGVPAESGPGTGYPTHPDPRPGRTAYGGALCGGAWAHGTLSGLSGQMCSGAVWG